MTKCATSTFGNELKAFSPLWGAWPKTDQTPAAFLQDELINRLTTFFEMIVFIHHRPMHTFVFYYLPLHFTNSKYVGIRETASESHLCHLMMSMSDRRWLDITMIYTNVKEKIFTALLMWKLLCCMSFLGGFFIHQSCYVPARQLHRESAGEHYSKCDSSAAISVHLVMQHFKTPPTDTRPLISTFSDKKLFILKEIVR